MNQAPVSLSPKPVRQAPRSVLAYQHWSSSPLFTSILTHKKGAYRRTVFMPGCALASYSPWLVHTTYAHLSRALPGLGLVQHCCANPVLSTGDTAQFAYYYGKLEQELEKKELDTVIAACANCQVTLQSASPNLKVRSLYEVLLETGIPQRDYHTLPPAVLHDPCPIRQEAALHASVRSLLRQMRCPFEEFPRNRAHTLCCGSGGMLALTNPDRALAMMRRRAAQSAREVAISYCQSCVASLTRGGKRGWHLLDLVFGELPPDFVQPKQSPLRRWLNRYLSKRATWSLR